VSAPRSFTVKPERVEAVVFDLGGVLIEGGPSEVVAFGKRVGLAVGAWESIRRDLFGNDGPWAELERGEIGFEAFIDELKTRLRDCGTEVSDDEARTFLGSPRPLGDVDTIRPAMIEAVGRLKAVMPTALLTNNVREWRDGWRGAFDLDALFDVVIDSSEVGSRKPEPRIYEITQARLGVDHDRILFIDDIGQNLKAARQLGWQTVLFKDVAGALAVIDSVLGAR
jgi:putative hydrolase of the HAD superfamily